jgi:D-glycero-alpha-D-manno-heptose 1-phosphate guanylyltransferase
MEAIILAGGFGTRLQSVVKDVPKPMADINGKPFLEYILKHISSYGVDRVILSVGYKQDIIKDHFGDIFCDTNILYSCEDEPLGTGGAIKEALRYANDDFVLVLNGDTFFDIELDEFCNSDKSDIKIALKKMKDVDRYGSVEIDQDSSVVAFKEKQYFKETLINGGIYLIKKDIFSNIDQSNFSFEKFIEDNIGRLNIVASSEYSNSYFIDIGIPTDYAKAAHDFKEIFKDN